VLDIQGALFEIPYYGNRFNKPEIKTCLMDLFGPKGNLGFLNKIERHDNIKTPKGILNAILVYNKNVGALYEVKIFGRILIRNIKL
jgi:hypothetical protein